MSRRPRQERPYADLQSALGSLGEVRAPGDAEEPVLAPMVRGWLHNWITEIRHPEELLAVKVKPRTTAVLHGPPGCGKTTLAHHLSARLGLPLVIVGPETIYDMYVGQSEGNMGRLFRAVGGSDVPCVLFIDELDSLGRKRAGSSASGGSDARNNVLTVLLRKIEEFEGYLIGATNRPDDLDPALWRRFHMQLMIGLPGEEERFAILRRYGLPYNFSDDDLDILVGLTDGASPALLRGLMEGIKRALVIYPKLPRPVNDPVALVASVIASVRPPSAVEVEHLPPMWRGGLALSELRGLAWPPTLGGDGAAP